MFGNIKKNNFVTTISKFGPFYEYRFEFYINSYIGGLQNIFEIRKDGETCSDYGTGIWIVPGEWAKLQYSIFNIHTLYNNCLHAEAKKLIPLKLKTWIEVEVTTTSENGKVLDVRVTSLNNKPYLERG